jgi:Flp pilus assembly secretin CpaC
MKLKRSVALGLGTALLGTSLSIFLPFNTSQGADLMLSATIPVSAVSIKSPTDKTETKPTVKPAPAAAPAKPYVAPVQPAQGVAYQAPRKAPVRRAAAPAKAKAPAAYAPQQGYVSVFDTTGIRSGIAATQDIEVTQGKAKIVDLRQPAARVAISDPSVAHPIMISPTQIQIVGKKVGVANLIVWTNSGSNYHHDLDITVQRDVSTLTKQLQLIDPNLNVVPMAAKDTVVLTGEVESRESAQLAIELAKAFFSTSDGNAGGGRGSSGGQGQSSGGGSASGGSPASSGGGSSGGAGGALLSQAPGTSLPGPSPNIINLIKVRGVPTTKQAMAREQLRELDPGIELNVVPGPNGEEKAMLTGRVRTSGIISKAINIASIYYGAPGIKMLTGPGGNVVRNTGNANFQQETSFSDNMDVNVLQGTIMTDSTGNVVSMLEVSQKPQITCSIQFLDVSKNALKQLGATLSGGAGDMTYGTLAGNKSPALGKEISAVDSTQSGTIFGQNYLQNKVGQIGGTTMNRSGFAQLAQTYQNGVTQFIALNSRLGAALSALEEKRKVRSLAEPTLTMLSGEKASFLAGGEIAIPVVGGNGSVTVEYKEFGIRLNLIATVTEEGKIHMLVAPEVSEVDPNNVITTNLVSVPGFRTRRMQTTLEIEEGQSFVMAGLYNQMETDSISKTPGVGNLPILGTFFKNKWGSRQDNEMVVIIKPTVTMLSNGRSASTPTYGHQQPSGKGAGAMKDAQEIAKAVDTQSEAHHEVSRR